MLRSFIDARVKEELIELFSNKTYKILTQRTIISRQLVIKFLYSGSVDDPGDQIQILEVSYCPHITYIQSLNVIYLTSSLFCALFTAVTSVAVLHVFHVRLVKASLRASCRWPPRLWKCRGHLGLCQDQSVFIFCSCSLLSSLAFFCYKKSLKGVKRTQKIKGWNTSCRQS